MNEHIVEKDAPRYLSAEWDAICLAKRTYLDALTELQASCEHKTLLKYTSSNYRTTRACEDCGYHESVQWDSGYKYNDQRLLARAYDVSWQAICSVFPKVQPEDRDAARATPPEVSER